jgi:T5SS/PEP-CTERM-associated repeat protein
VIIGNTSVGLNNGGVLNVNGGTFNVTGSQELGDELIIGDGASGGSLNVTGGADVNVTGGPHANVVMGRGGINNYATVSGAGSALTISGSISIGELNFSTMSIENGGQLTSGTGVLGKSSLFASGQVIIDGAGSAWTNNGDSVIGRLGTGNLFVQNGGQVLTSGSAYLGELSGSMGNVGIYGAGSTWTIGGNLVVGRTGTSPSSYLRVYTGNSVNVGGLLTVASTGIVEGNGNISADINNSGTVDPYGIPFLDGALQIDGTYTQTVAGTLLIDIGGTLPGTNYDQLLVSGAVSLNGTLQVLLTNSFVPSVGDVFNIIDGASLSSTFNTLQLPSLPSGISWNATQLYTTGSLLVTIAGDFDADGDVDGRDFLLWQRGGSLNPFSATDLADWQANYGMGGLIAASTAVPEPETFSFSLASLLAVFYFYRSLKVRETIPGV